MSVDPLVDVRKMRLRDLGAVLYSWGFKFKDGVWRSPLQGNDLAVVLEKVASLEKEWDGGA